jgi:hypothetical protein
MTDEDKRIIERYARAHYANPRIEAMRQDAIVAHRRYLGTKWGRDIHMLFMSEVDNPCPDYSLRATYRKQLLEGGKP